MFCITITTITATTTMTGSATTRAPYTTILFFITAYWSTESMASVSAMHIHDDAIGEGRRGRGRRIRWLVGLDS